MKNTIFILFSVFLLNEVHASIPLSLFEAIRLAQEYSLDAKLARFKFLGSYWTYQSYKTKLLPSASLDGSLLNYDRSFTSVRNYENGRINYVENNSLTNSLTLSVSQNIVATGGTVSLQSYLYRLDQFTYNERTYNTQPLRLIYNQPLRTYNSLKWLRKSEPINYERAKRQYLESMQNIAITVTNLYFSVLSAQSDYKQAVATAKERGRLHEQMKRRYTLGTVSQSELLQLELSAVNARMALKRNLLTLNDTRFQLFTYLQAVRWNEVELLIPQDIPNLILDEQNVIQRAMQTSTHSIIQRLSLIESERNLAEAKSQRGIQLSLHSELGLRNTANRLGAAYSQLQDNEIVGLSLSLPIFDWGMSKGRVRIAKANLDMVKTRIEQEDLNYQQTLRRLVMQFNLQHEQCQEAARAQEIANERYIITLQRFETGSINVTELNTAQQEKELALAQYINQLQTYWNGYYNIQRHTLWNYINNYEITTDFNILVK